jgi:hypothetical protein
MARRSGWQIQASNGNKMPIMPATLAAFDLLLYKLNVKEKEAARHAKVRAWVKQNYTRRYVPESVLEALGLELGVFCD